MISGPAIWHLFRFGYIYGSAWSDRNQQFGRTWLTIRLRYAYDTLTIRLRYAYICTILLRYSYDTLTILLRYSYDTLTILLRYSYDTLTIHSNIWMKFQKQSLKNWNPKIMPSCFLKFLPCSRVQWESLEWQSTRGLRVESSENNGNDPTSDQQKQLVSRLSFFLRCLPKFVKVSCM